MAEVFGVVTGAISIAALFNNCVSCFEYIQLGRHFGEDYERCQLRLDIARTRLGRWGEAISINDNPLLNFNGPNGRETQLARSILEEILLLFDSAQRTSKRYQLIATQEDQAVFKDEDMDIVSRGLHNRLKDLARKQQKGASLAKKAGWALYDGKKLESLVERIVAFTGELEDLVPVSEACYKLVEAEVTELDDEPSLTMLKDAARGIDSVLAGAVEQKISAVAGRNYAKHVKATELAQVLLGNDISESFFHGLSITTTNSTENIEAMGSSKVHVGNRIGGGKFL
jgi:hypothetical protein